MSGCCGYQTLQWYYTYPSNPYRFVQPQSVPTVVVVPVREEYTPEPPEFWQDVGRGWT